MPERTILAGFGSRTGRSAFLALLALPVPRRIARRPVADLENMPSFPAGISAVLGFAAIDIAGDPGVNDPVAQFEVVLVRRSAGRHLRHPCRKSLLSRKQHSANFSKSLPQSAVDVVIPCGGWPPRPDVPVSCSQSRTAKGHDTPSRSWRSFLRPLGTVAKFPFDGRRNLRLVRVGLHPNLKRLHRPLHPPVVQLPFDHMGFGRFAHPRLAGGP